MRCEQCHAEKLVAFSCKKRGFCPSCGARRMAETAALLADEVLPERPLRQWVLSLPHALRFLLATNPAAVTLVLGVVYRTIARHLIGKAGLTRSRAATGAVTLIQRFGSALNLNIHFHMLFLDGVYLFKGAHPPLFRPVAGPRANELQRLVEQIGAQVGQVLERRGLLFALTLVAAPNGHAADSVEAPAAAVIAAAAVPVAATAAAAPAIAASPEAAPGHAKDAEPSAGGRRCKRVSRIGKVGYTRCD